MVLGLGQSVGAERVEPPFQLVPLDDERTGDGADPPPQQIIADDDQQLPASDACMGGRQGSPGTVCRVPVTKSRRFPAPRPPFPMVYHCSGRSTVSSPSTRPRLLYLRIRGNGEGNKRCTEIACSVGAPGLTTWWMWWAPNATRAGRGGRRPRSRSGSSSRLLQPAPGSGTASGRGLVQQADGGGGTRRPEPRWSCAAGLRARRPRSPRPRCRPGFLQRDPAALARQGAQPGDGGRGRPPRSW